MVISEFRFLYRIMMKYKLNHRFRSNEMLWKLSQIVEGLLFIEISILKIFYRTLKGVEYYFFSALFFKTELKILLFHTHHSKLPKLKKCRLQSVPNSFFSALYIQVGKLTT